VALAKTIKDENYRILNRYWEATPTEILTAWNAGADMVKVFPAAQLGGPEYIKALRGPLPQILLVPTGGVNLQNAGAFIKAGCVALGVGGELVDKNGSESEASSVDQTLCRYLAVGIKDAFEGSGLTPIYGAEVSQTGGSLHQRIDQIRRAKFGIFDPSTSEKTDVSLNWVQPLAWKRRSPLFIGRATPCLRR
jgi:hypothetical protein